MRWIALALLAGVVAAEDEEQSTYRKQYEEKLSKPFAKNADWVHGYDEALKRAKAEGKIVFAYFTRSYSP